MGIRVLKAVLGNLWKLARPLVPRLPQRIQRVLVIIPLCVLFLFLWLSIRNLSVSSNERTNEQTNIYFGSPKPPYGLSVIKLPRIPTARPLVVLRRKSIALVRRSLMVSLDDLDVLQLVRGLVWNHILGCTHMRHVAVVVHAILAIGGR